MKEDYNNIVGRNITRARKLLNITQVELSKKTGIDQRQISRYEAGQVRKDEYLFMIAHAFGILPDDLMADEILYIKNGVRVLVEGKVVLRRTPAQCLSDVFSIRFDPMMIDTPENRKQLVKEADKIAVEIGNE